MELKLTKNEVNKILYDATIKNKTYGLILKLEYIYAKNISDVLNLKKEDINLDNNTIKFKLSKSVEYYPLVSDIKRLLELKINEITDNEYLFIDEELTVGVLTKKLNYFLSTVITEINRTTLFKFKVITNRDLKMLRGQHLYYDNVPLDIIHKLYNNFNLKETRDFLRYDEIREDDNYSNVEEMLLNYTNLNIFDEETYNKGNIFVVIDRNDEMSIIEFNYDEMIVHDESGASEQLSKWDAKKLEEDLSDLHSGEFKYLHGLKFIKD